MTSGYSVRDVPCGDVVAGDNDRKRFGDDDLRVLADSIRQNGLAQPITVRPNGKHYEIVAGERRFRAVSQILGWSSVPALVRELDDDSASGIMLAENLARVDLDPVEEALGYHSRMERFGWSHDEMAARAGIGVERLKNRLGLLRLVPEAQHLVKTGQLGVKWGVSLSPLSPDYQRAALASLKKDVTWRQWDELCQRLLFRQQEQSLFEFEMVAQEFEAAKKGARGQTRKSALDLLRRVADAAEGVDGLLPDELRTALDDVRTALDLGEQHG